MFIPGAPMSQEEIEREKRIEDLHAYYGIPILLFTEKDTPMIRDWNEASLLICMGKPIPDELEKRLLGYKRDKIGS